MLPASSKDNRSDAVGLNAIATGKRGIRPAFRRCLSYHDDFVRREFGAPDTFAAHCSFRVGVAPIAATACRPAFRVPVRDIVQLGSEEEMGWIDAVAHVATMQHFHAIGDWPVLQFVGEAMSEVSSPVDCHSAVPARFQLASPQPAAVGLVHHAPELLCPINLTRRGGSATTPARTSFRSLDRAALATRAGLDVHVVSKREPRRFRPACGAETHTGKRRGKTTIA